MIGTRSFSLTVFVLGASALLVLPWTAGCGPSQNVLDPSAGQGQTGITVDTVSPDHGLADGGTDVTVTGTGFVPGAKLRFGDREATAIEVQDDATLTVTAPDHPAGTVDITITNPDGKKVVAPNAFNFGGPVSPPSGPVIGGTVVTILAPANGRRIDPEDWVVFAVVDEANSTPNNPQLLQVTAATDVTILNKSSALAVTPPHEAGDVGVFILSDNGQLNMVGEFTYETSVSNDRLARVVGAIATGNTTVRVAFDKRMGEGLEDPENYEITGSEGETLGVTGVVATSDRTIVDLTTLSQAGIDYKLHVVAVKDKGGNPLAAPDGLLAPLEGPDPATATFHGIAPIIDGENGVNEQVDTDGDGFADWFEQIGWFVTVHYDDGTVSTAHVTSDPTSPDTDGDGILDGDENRDNLDPRTDDTDADQISDWDEYNVYYSDPRWQDSDEDGIGDYLEIKFFHTSPIQADTDGDQMSDAEELFERSRNPLIADLPVPQITVDSLRLDVKVTSSFTDEEGVTHSVSDTQSTSISQSRSSSLGRSDTKSVESENQASQKAGGEFNFPGGKVFGEVGAQQSRARGFSSTVDRQTSEASQRDWQESVTKALETSESRSVTRNIDEAIVQATVSLANQSDIAFTLTNLELSLLQQDRFAGLTFRPIATLRPTGASDPLSQPSYNLGPFDLGRGPIIFENVEVFPNLVDDLLREPTGLVFKVANLDVVDEFDRNLVFTTQDVNDHTASLSIDFGDGTVELYRIATASTFDVITGLPDGITLERALQIAGLAKAPDEDIPLPEGPLSSAMRNSYGTIIADGVEELTRIRGVQNDLSDTDPEARGWIASFSNPNLSRSTNFSEFRLYARDNVTLFYTRDKDADGLFEREEYLYGSDDEKPDSDDDSLPDFDEIRTGWTVYRLPGQPYKAFPSPVRPDSDLDGLEDPDEMAAGTDPNRADTDEDGLSDSSELNDTLVLNLFDGDDDPSDDPPTLFIAPYSDQSITAGPNGICDTVTTTGDDDLATLGYPTAKAYRLCVTSGNNGVIDTVVSGDDTLASAGNIAPGPDRSCNTPVDVDSDDVAEWGPGFSPATYGGIGTICISAGADGVINTRPLGDDFERVAHHRLFGTDPLNQDTDRDGLPDGRELLLGTNPNARDAGNIIDTDNDGLFDQEEDDGWEVVLDDDGLDNDGDDAIDEAGESIHVTSDKNRPDSDRDGIPDVFERAIKTDPRLPDTDRDELSDYDEFDLDDDLGIYDAPALALAKLRCADATNCFYEAPGSDDLVGTNPRRRDTDGDTVRDDVELDRSWFVQRPQDQNALKVWGDPKYADVDVDGLNDAEEYAAQSHPQEADWDGDLRKDGREVECRLQPNRQDFRMTVTLASIYAIGDCDTEISEGLELEGEFQLQLPDLELESLFKFNCIGDDPDGEWSQDFSFCGGGGCCIADGREYTPCDGETLYLNVTSQEFQFSEGQQFTLTSSELRDHDNHAGCGEILVHHDDLGRMDEVIDFAVPLPVGHSVNMEDPQAATPCLIEVTYTFNDACPP